MGLKAGLSLLMLLLVRNIGTTDAVMQQRTEDVLVAPPSTDTGKHFSRADFNLKRESGIVSPMTKVQAPEGSGTKLRRLIGSSAPECGHTCGACAPCKIQVVSYECSEALAPHAEACPLGYLCICHGRSFPIP